MPSITFTVHKGKVTAKAAGYKGTACETAIKNILAGLGKSEASEHIYPDYAEQELDGTQQVEGGA